MSAPPINTAACIIIGDEVLNGKILDTNSKFFARFCFRLGINVRHMSIIPDVEGDIVDEVRRLSAKYDFIVTTGGIGSTHDDVTYQSIAKAVGVPLALDQTTADKMTKMSSHIPKNEKASKAQLRMATLPKGPNIKYHYPAKDLWVPVVAIDSKIHIFPGVPHLFEELLEGLVPLLKPRLNPNNIMERYFVNLPGAIEASMAHYLSDLQKANGDKGVKIGSYPHLLSKSITISILGPKNQDKLLQSIKEQVLKDLGGKELSADQESLEK